MDNNYKYKGIPITAAIAEYIIKSFLRDKQLERSEIINAVERIHSENGGLPTQANLTSIVKKALSNLKEQGIATNPRSGWWSIGQSIDAEDLTSQVPPDLVVKEDVDKDTQQYKIDSVVGAGEEAVYVYYYPTYKKEALAAGRDRWLCKIGRTDRLPRIRISEQTTGMPEQPVIGLVINTDDSRAVEVVVKNVLSLRGQWSEDSPGAEWFVTSPDDILQLIKLLVPKFNTDKTEV
jgi:hypothetical protein